MLAPVPQSVDCRPVANLHQYAQTALATVSHEAAPVNTSAGSIGLTLDEAISISLDRNPNLVALRASEPVAHAVYHVAETYPWNPYVQVEVLPYARDREGNLGKVTNYVLLMQTLELAHQRRHREASAAAAWDQVHWNVVQAELTTAAQTQRLYFAALYQRALRDLAQQTASLNEDLLGIVQRRFQAALATAAEQTTAQVTARQSHKLTALAEANYQTSLLALRRQLNLSSDEPFTLVAQVEDFVWLPVCGDTSASEDALKVKIPDDLVSAWALERPDVMAAQAGVGSAAANADLARANMIPNVQIGPFYERDDAGTLFAGFRTQMDLPVWNNGRPLVQQRQAEFHQQLTTLDQLRARAMVEAQTAIERYERARRLAELEHTDFSQALPDELRKIKAQFEAGQADILNVFAVQNALLQEHRTLLDLWNELAQAAADVTLAAGLPPARLITTHARDLPELELVP